MTKHYTSSQYTLRNANRGNQVYSQQVCLNKNGAVSSHLTVPADTYIIIPDQIIQRANLSQLEKFELRYAGQTGTKYAMLREEAGK